MWYNISHTDAVIAQLVEQPPCKRQVVGSSPTHGSMMQAEMLVFFSDSCDKIDLWK